MSRDIIDTIALDFGRAFKPLEDALASPEAFAGLAARLGWTVDAIPGPIGALAGPLSNLSAVVRSVAAGGADAATLANLLVELKDAYDAVDGLETASFPPLLTADGFAAEFPRQLVEFLLVDYLTLYRPRVGYLLRALGIIRYRYQPAAGNRPDYMLSEVAWGNIADVLTDPGQLFENVYGWRTNAFDTEEVLQAIHDLLLSLGVSAFLEEMDERVSDAVQDNTTTPDEPAFSINAPLFDHGDGVTQLTAGLELLGLPTRGTLKPGLALLPYVSGSFSEDFQLSEHLFLTLRSGLDMAGGIGLKLRPSGLDVVSGLSDPDNLTQVEGSASIGIAHRDASGAPIVVVGSAEGSRFEYKTLSLLGGLAFDAGSDADLFLELALEGGAIVVKPSEGDAFLRKILPGDGFTSTVDLVLGLSMSQGFYFRGSGGLELQIPVHVEVGPVELESVTVALKAASTGTLDLELGASANATLGPVSAAVDNVGLKAEFTFPGKGGNLGPVDVDLSFLPPTGVGLSINAGGFKGGGFLSFEPDEGRYVGIVELEFQSTIALKAIGLLTTKLPDGSDGFSLLIIITAEFTPIQLGFGFTLNGVGGLIGINRTIVVERLRSGVKDNTLSSILFPTDIVANANRIISDLRQVFPPSEGQFVVGPMAKIGWGTPTLITVDLGLIVELPDPVRIAILGVLKTLLPDENSIILRLQVNFLGVLDFEQQMLSFDASIYDSKLLSFTLSGDMALRIAWGNDPNFLLSVGGFHPAYEPPPLALPDMARLSISLLGGSNPRISIETYFAVTSNTVQFGAKVELYAGAGPFNVYGFLGFDVLFQFSPFYFNAAIGAMLALRAGSSSIASISLAGTLEGPTPWKVAGAAKLKLFWFLTIKVRFSAQWGDSRGTELDDVKVLPLLTEALGKTGNWTAEIPTRSHLLVSLRTMDTAPDRVIAHPFGTLSISQKVVPLNLVIDKFGNRVPSDGNEFSIRGVTAGEGASSVDLETTDVDEQFAPAQFLDMKDSDKLSSKSFEKYDGGVTITDSEALRSGAYAMRAVDYELSYVDSQRNLRRWPFLVALDPFAFNAWSTQGAISLSPLSHAKSKKPALAPDAVQLTQEPYAIVGTADLSLFDDQSALASEGAAASRLRQLVAADPKLAGELQVVPAFEVQS